jgi:REP element-mobilizing transposase RayT
MDEETFRNNKPYAGPKKPSMNRRCVGFDYRQRCIYLITMTVEGRRPLFGSVVGDCDEQPGQPNYPHIELSQLGRAVEKAWNDIPQFHPEIQVLALQMMPDHLHGILFVQQAMGQPLGKVINGFKVGCNRAYRELGGVAALQQHTEHTSGQEMPGEKEGRPAWRDHGLLFSPGFNDKILWRKGELEAWQNYLNDNPRRLLVKRQHPDYFRVNHRVAVGGITFDALGNLFLLHHPRRLQVQCSRSLTDEEIATRREAFLAEARDGAVLVSPSISKGEKAIMRAAYEQGFPLIVLRENGFTEMSKPHGSAFDACSKGQLLIVAPWEHHNEQLKIKRGQCLQLNEMARILCESHP